MCGVEGAVYGRVDTRLAMIYKLKAVSCIDADSLVTRSETDRALPSSSLNSTLSILEQLLELGGNLLQRSYAR